MEPENFPKYYPGQFLTSENLNDSFAYLEKQDRLSRSKLSGYGICNGLNYSFNASMNTLTIQPGAAVTVDGYLINFPQSVNYKHKVKYEKEMVNFSDNQILNDAWLFFETAEEIEVFDKKPNTSIISLTGYALCIIVDLAEERAVKCNQKSCDINNSNIKVVYRPVLIKQDKLNKMNVFGSSLSIVKTNRLQKIIESRDLNLLSQKVKDLFKTNRNKIVTTLSVVANNGIVNDTQLQNSISLLRNMAEKMTEIPSYYLLFLEDVKTAINEFVVFYNYCINTYSFFTANVPKERLVILGTNQNFDYYKNNFRYLYPDPNKTNDCNTLSRLFYRISVLINSFMGNRVVNEANTIKLIPSKDGLSKLEERAIPYYYSYNTISPYWKVGLPDSAPAIYHYKSFQTDDYYNNPDGCPLFRLEGYYNQDIKQVYKKISELVEKHDLPIKVVKMELLKIKYLKKSDIAKLTDLFYRATQAPIMSHLKRTIRGKFTGLQFNNIKSKLKDLSLITNPKKYYDLKLNRLNIPNEDINKAYEVFSSIDIDDFCQFYYSLYKEIDPALISNIYKEPTIAAISTLSSIISKMRVKNYKMAEYIGGVQKNNTLILLYFNNKVIMDITMPGFSEENSEKKTNSVGI